MGHAKRAGMLLGLSDSSGFCPGRRRPLVVAIIAAVAALLWRADCPTAPAETGQTPSVEEWLDAYAAGDTKEAVDRALGPDLKGIPFALTTLKRQAPRWASRDGPDNVPRQRLIVATFVLDIAHAVYQAVQRDEGASDGQSLADTMLFAPPPAAVPHWDALKPLIEWACAWLRKTRTPDPLERDWFIASVQVLRDFNDPAVAVVPVFGSVRAYGVLRGHLADAVYRFPDEPWFRVVLAERQDYAERTLGKSNWTAAIQAVYRGLSYRSNVSAEGAAEAIADLLEMRRALVPLHGESEVRAEVDVHLGCIALILGEYASAREYLDEIDSWTSDTCLQYLGHFLRGRTDDTEGRLADAEQAYRSALAILPDTPSGLTALAAVLALEGRQPEAALLAAKVFTVPPTTLDPSVELWKGTGCTRWPDAMGRLRAGLGLR